MSFPVLSLAQLPLYYPLFMANTHVPLWLEQRRRTGEERNRSLLAWYLLHQRDLGFGGAQGQVPSVQDSAPAEGNKSVSVIHTLSWLNDLPSISSTQGCKLDPGVRAQPFTLVCADGHRRQLHHRAWTEQSKVAGQDGNHSSFQVPACLHHISSLAC